MGGNIDIATSFMNKVWAAWHARRCYMMVIPWALVVHLIYASWRPRLLGFGCIYQAGCSCPWMCFCDLPDMYALGLRAYISGKSLVPILQLLHKQYKRLGCIASIIIPIQKSQACMWLLQAFWHGWLQPCGNPATKVVTTVSPVHCYDLGIETVTRLITLSQGC